MCGSATLVSCLLANDLLDDLGPMIHPIAVGEGQRLFDDSTPYPLRLVRSEVSRPAC